MGLMEQQHSLLHHMFTVTLTLWAKGGISFQVESLFPVNISEIQTKTGTTVKCTNHHSGGRYFGVMRVCIWFLWWILPLVWHTVNWQGGVVKGGVCSLLTESGTAPNYSQLRRTANYTVTKQYWHERTRAWDHTQNYPLGISNTLRDLNVLQPLLFFTITGTELLLNRVLNEKTYYKTLSLT